MTEDEMTEDEMTGRAQEREPIQFEIMRLTALVDFLRERAHATVLETIAGWSTVAYSDRPFSREEAMDKFLNPDASGKRA